MMVCLGAVIRMKDTEGSIVHGVVFGIYEDMDLNITLQVVVVETEEVLFGFSRVEVLKFLPEVITNISIFNIDDVCDEVQLHPDLHPVWEWIYIHLYPEFRRGRRRWL